VTTQAAVRHALRVPSQNSTGREATTRNQVAPGVVSTSSSTPVRAERSSPA